MAQFDESFDWVVVGSGAGSMASALLMKQAGKSVLILEKAPWVGGTTAKSGGVMWIPNNRFMDPGEDSFEQACTYLDAVVPDGEDSPGTSSERAAPMPARRPGCSISSSGKASPWSGVRGSGPIITTNFPEA
ncbi:FAD-binding protein [Novosphingobium sp. ST904]|uniref:FAD-binding protein n=1 Tax=Novosphingobium sp. ST904 TaxID=1684385 RepID=UPI000AA8F86F|nr:FAD-binding protein [Novosphingobium sp. ST904]